MEKAGTETSGVSSSKGIIEDNEEQEVNDIENEVKLMADKIEEARANIPTLFSSTLTTVLEAARPIFQSPKPFHPSSPPSDLSHDLRQIREEQLRVVKEKIQQNATELRVTLKRLSECISKTDKLLASSPSDVEIIPRVFALKRRKVT